MKIVMVPDTYNESGGEIFVFRNECELPRNAVHEVIEYLCSKNETGQFVSIRRHTPAKRTILASGTQRQFRPALLRQRPQIVPVYNTSFRRTTRSNLDNHVPRTPSI